MEVGCAPREYPLKSPSKCVIMMHATVLPCLQEKIKPQSTFGKSMEENTGIVVTEVLESSGTSVVQVDVKLLACSLTLFDRIPRANTTEGRKTRSLANKVLIINLAAVAFVLGEASNLGSIAGAS